MICATGKIEPKKPQTRKKSPIEPRRTPESLKSVGPKPRRPPDLSKPPMGYLLSPKFTSLRDICKTSVFFFFAKGVLKKPYGLKNRIQSDQYRNIKETKEKRVKGQRG